MLYSTNTVYLWGAHERTVLWDTLVRHSGLRGWTDGHVREKLQDKIMRATSLNLKKAMLVGSEDLAI